jgi:hypothetical protein
MPESENPDRKKMSQMTKSRERAEAAFGKAQSQSLARNRTLSEEEAVVRARDEKTMRLRELRKAKEADDLAAGVTKGASGKST